MQEFLKEMISIRLRKGKQQSIDRKHPWVFSGALHLNNVACEDGELMHGIIERISILLMMQKPIVFDGYMAKETNCQD